ncbi:MAG: hypothetical protein FWC13_09170 [Oscillospiraceae bacterium]|nr:hypothetical protein [Oscillospiraceae bacterium]
MNINAMKVCTPYYGEIENKYKQAASPIYDSTEKNMSFNARILSYLTSATEPDVPEAVKTTQDILAYLREMMPGWVIAYEDGGWAPGFRNLKIEYELLQLMAECPEIKKKVKEIIRGFEYLVPKLEEWHAQNQERMLNISITRDANGNFMGLVSIGDSDGLPFELSEDWRQWYYIMIEKLEALRQNDNSEDVAA